MATATKKKTEKKQSNSGLLIIVAAGLGLWYLLKNGTIGGKATLKGTVLSGEDDSPIIGASVVIGSQTYTTGADGSFTATDLAAGLLQIEISADTFITRKLSINLVAGENTKTFQLFQESTSAGLTGRVTDINTGAALSGVKVTVAGIVGYTVADGTYSITGINAGSTPATLTFELQWYKTKATTKVLQSGANTLDMTLNNLGSVQGAVTDSVTQAPVIGATVSSGQYSAQTNNNGLYQLTLAAGSRQISVTKEGYQSQVQTATVMPEETTTLSFSLVQNFAQTGVVQGIVVNGNNQNPISGAQIVINPGNHQLQSGYQGNYSIELPANSFPGITYQIAVTAPGYQNYSGSVTVRTGTFNTKNIAMTPVQAQTGIVDGFVTRKLTGDPIAGAVVNIQNPTQIQAISDAEGYYRIENVPVGNYLMGVTATGYAQQTRNITVNANQVTRLPVFEMVSSGGGTGFYMTVEYDMTNYPTAAFWYAEVAGMVMGFKPVNAMWIQATDLNTRSWPSMLTVELYDQIGGLAGNRLAKKTKSVTLQNGHVYSFYVESNTLVDNGLF